MNQVKNGTGRIRASSSSGPGEATYSVKLTGPSQAAPVPEVSGRVTDSTSGVGIKDATVVVEDGANTVHSAGTDSQGRFRVVSTAQKPITPGQIKIGANKDGYEIVPLLVDGRSGQALTNQAVKLKPLSVSASAQPEVSDPNMTVDPSAVTEEEGDGNAAGSGTGDGGPGMISWVLIGLGGILVLLGIGAIFLLLRRRGEDDEEDGDDEVAPARPTRRGPAPAGAGARGGYRNPGAGDATMVNRAPMGAPTMANRGNLHDATAIVRPASVGVPPRANYPTSPPPGMPQSYAGPGGYGPAKPAYNGPNGPGTGYGPPDPGYGPPPGPGYGPSSRPAADGYSASDYAGGYSPPPSAGGYGGGGGYEDESTQRYDAGGYGPPSAGGYGGYGAGAAGGASPDRNGYGGGAGGGGGGVDRNGYGGGAGGGGGGVDRNGYDPGGGYEPDGYDRSPDPRGGSYGPSSYDGPGGRSGGYDNGYQQPPPRRPNERLDWMDD
jgi:hypothetical protein